MTKFLPAGSVVKLKMTGDTLIMIIGFMQQIEEHLYDYIGVPYPIGMMNEKSCVAFKEHQISEVVFEGYENERGKVFNEAVPAMILEKIRQKAEEARENSAEE